MDGVALCVLPCDFHSLDRKITTWALHPELILPPFWTVVEVLPHAELIELRVWIVRAIPALRLCVDSPCLSAYISAEASFLWSRLIDCNRSIFDIPFVMLCYEVECAASFLISYGDIVGLNMARGGGGGFLWEVW